MTKWKVGDVIGLRVEGVTLGGWPTVRTRNGMALIDHETIEPIPTPDPHQALKTAVVEAAKVWREGRTVFDSWSPSAALLRTIDALTAAQTPPKPDPVEVFYEVAGDNLCVCSSKTWKLCRSKPDECACRRRIARGLAATDAARGAK